MATIHVLDKNTIDQIAAGEVVERPASIVKELVENAIDARSTAVTIEIKGGGIEFIRITDNGSGIERNQVPTAFLRHATSKINDASDLETVSSLGFRGEALSSIAAVAKVELITKTDEGISGIRYVIEGGEEISNEEIGCPEGTTFLVRDLFYNTPARRKFLKSKMTEAGYVEAYVQRLALSHPEISFRFISDNKNKISTSGNGNLKDVIYHIFGRDFATNLLEVNSRPGNVTISGYIGKPVISRGNRNFENYFVNGRYLKSNIIARAIEDGYKGHAMVHKFPFTVINIEMDAHYFDVNVHPAKLEMRFENGDELYSSVMTAVKQSFVKKELIPSVGIGRSNDVPKAAVPARPEPFENRRRQIEERFKNLSKETVADIEKKKQEDTEIPEKPEVIKPQIPAAQTLKEKVAKLRLSNLEGVKEEIDQVFKVSDSAKYSEKEEAPSENEKTEEITGEQMSFMDHPLLAKEAKPDHRIIGQVFKTYWLVEYEDKLFFVDQHAAHEKVMYEKLRRNLAEKKIDRQMVSPPIVLNLSMREREALLRCKESFEKLGYQVEEFGSDAFAIRAVPANLYGIDQQDLFVDVLDQVDDNFSKMDITMITDRLATMSCKAAVKGNQRISYQEMDALMDQLLELEDPYQCPHGRPTIISMTKYEIEKKFSR